MAENKAERIKLLGVPRFASGHKGNGISLLSFFSLIRASKRASFSCNDSLMFRVNWRDDYSIACVH